MPFVHHHDRAIARFWVKVDQSSGPLTCWPWTGTPWDKPPWNYGKASWQGKRYKAHRVAFFLTHGTWPEVCRHTCDNPPCCNPMHLLDGSLGDNNRDREARGRGAQPHGEAHSQCVLTDLQVHEIRIAATGYGTGVQLARAYGVSPSQISRIRRDQSRKR